jgi:hypothetical protein
MDLIHFSKAPLGPLRSVGQEPVATYKPQGLWLSDEASEDSWSAWCQDEGFKLEALACRTRVYLDRHATVLIITRAMQLRHFSHRYHAPFLGASRRESYAMAIDWARVAEVYQGIVITPFQPECRLDDATWWYYGWDCASGCIWDADAIARMEPLSGDRR